MSLFRHLSQKSFLFIGVFFVFIGIAISATNYNFNKQINIHPETEHIGAFDLSIDQISLTANDYFTVRRIITNEGGSSQTTSTKVQSSSFDTNGYTSIFTDTGSICSNITSDQGDSSNECVSIRVPGKKFRVRFSGFSKIRAARYIRNYGTYKWDFDWSNTLNGDNLSSGYRVGTWGELTSGNVKKYGIATAPNYYLHSHFYFSAKVEAVCTHNGTTYFQDDGETWINTSDHI